MFQRRSFGHTSFGPLARSPLSPPRRARSPDTAQSRSSPHPGATELRLGLWLVPLVLRRDNPLRAALERARGALRTELGVDVPLVHTADDLSLEGNAYELTAGETVVCRGSARVERMLAINGGDIVRRVAGHAAVDPVGGHDAIWIDRREHHRALSAGYRVHEPASAIAEHVAVGLRQLLAPVPPAWCVHSVVESVDSARRTTDSLAEVRRRVALIRERRGTGDFLRGSSAISD